VSAKQRITAVRWTGHKPNAIIFLGLFL